MAKKVAVLLSGCGVYDGSEIQEAVLTLLALDNAGAQYACCAPDAPQMHVVDHVTGKPTGETRNVLVEAARIARGKILPAAGVRAADFDALILPGGFGAAKNLSNYAAAGGDAVPAPDAARLIREFHAAGKPVGAICIAPAVVAAAFRNSPDVHPVLTIGDDRDTAAHLEAMGAVHQPCGVKEIVTDTRNRIVSTPAYMYQTSPAEIAVGIEKLVRAVLEMAGGY